MNFISKHYYKLFTPLVFIFLFIFASDIFKYQDVLKILPSGEQFLRLGLFITLFIYCFIGFAEFGDKDFHKKAKKIKNINERRLFIETINAKLDKLNILILSIFSVTLGTLSYFQMKSDELWFFMALYLLFSWSDKNKFKSLHINTTEWLLSLMKQIARQSRLIAFFLLIMAIASYYFEWDGWNWFGKEPSSQRMYYFLSWGLTFIFAVLLVASSKEDINQLNRISSYGELNQFIGDNPLNTFLLLFPLFLGISNTLFHFLIISNLFMSEYIAYRKRKIKKQFIESSDLSGL